MTSEVDPRDWEKIDFSAFKKQEDGRYRLPSLHEMLDFVDAVEKLREKQLARSPALLRKDV